MKRLCLLMLLVFGITFGMEAQNRSINFQSIEWKKALKQAKKEKKLIFVDCYTSWCGPCKMLAKDVFTQDAVADFFNQNFLNLKMDMEKDADGVALKSAFEIKAFPTLVFVDPVTQQVVHRMVGAGTAEWLLTGAKIAKDPQNNLNGLTNRYEAGERTPKFLSQYLNALASAYMADEQTKVAVEYINSLSDEQLVTKENWDLIAKNIKDPLSKPMRYVMANREKFYAIAGKEVVDYVMANAIHNAVMSLALWRPGMATPFPEKRNDKMKKYLLSIDYESAPAALANLYTAELVRKGDFRGVLDNMKEVFKYNLFRNGEKKQYFQLNIESLTQCADKTLVEEGIKWIDAMCLDTDDFFEKANLMNSKMRLQTKIGDTLGADKSKMEEEKYTKEGVAKSGGRVTRAMRMN